MYGCSACFKAGAVPLHPWEMQPRTASGLDSLAQQSTPDSRKRCSLLLVHPPTPLPNPSENAACLEHNVEGLHGCVPRCSSVPP